MGDVAGVDEAQRQHGQRGLGADAVVDLGVGIEAGHAEELAHVLGGGDLELADAVVGVAAVGGIVDRLLQRLADGGGRHLVRLADAEVEQFDVGRAARAAALARLIFSNL
jgi:hypothetical protein